MQSDVILLSIFSFPRNDEIDLHNIIMSLYVITNFFGVCFRVYVFVWSCVQAMW